MATQTITNSNKFPLGTSKPSGYHSDTRQPRVTSLSDETWECSSNSTSTTALTCFMTTTARSTMAILSRMEPVLLMASFQTQEPRQTMQPRLPCYHATMVRTHFQLHHPVLSLWQVLSFNWCVWSKVFSHHKVFKQWRYPVFSQEQCIALQTSSLV